jgi:Phospholipase_D-nuclease N-terminal
MTRHGGPPLAALLPVALAGAAFVIYCLVDIARRPAVRYLPRWAWGLICCISMPLGGIIYLTVGRGE